MCNPTILVVMPLYNAANYVEQAVDSVLSQTYSGYHLLIVDDGSTDGSGEIVKKYTEERVTILRQANSGPAAAMNVAIQYAYERQIPFIARMDADDISMPERLATLLRLLMKHPEAAACSCNCYYIHPVTQEIIGTSLVPASPRLINWELLHGLRGLIQGACLFRTQALYDVGGYRLGLLQSEDTDLFLRLAERYELINSADFLYHIRLNPESISVKYYEQSALNQFYTLDCSSRRRHGMPELDFDSFRSSLGRVMKFKIWKEIKVLQLWREYLVQRNFLSFVMASLLSPYRVLARILRATEKKS